MKKIFVNGSFDLLHPGHILLLNKAKSLGDYLFVAIDSDRRITEKKGRDRPINDQTVRKTIISNLKAVNEVKIFDSDYELRKIIETYSPDIMMVGSDWKNKSVIGSEFAKQLIFFDRYGDYSTTNTIQNYLDRR